MKCQTVRTELHLEPDATGVQGHLAECAGCAAYAARFARLDGVLRGELLVAPPPALQQRLAMLPAPVPIPDRVAAAVRSELIMPAPAALTQRLLALVPEPAPVLSPLDLVVRDELVVQAPPALTARLGGLVPQMSAELQAARPRPRRAVVATVYFVTAALLVLSLMFAGQVYSTVITELGLEAWLARIAGLPAELLTLLYSYVPQARVVVGTLVELQQPLQWILVGLLVWAIVDMSQRQRDHQSSPRPQQYA
jgi:hypothetical protein